MLNLRVRLVNDNGTINSATSRVLPTHNIVYTTAVNEQGTLTFQVSRDDFVPTQFPFVVRVEQSVNGGSFAPTTQNSLFVVERDSDDSKDVGKIVTYEAVGFVPWLVQGALLSWASSAKDGKRTWYEPSKKPASAGYTFHGMLTEAKNGGWFPMLTWDFNGTRDSGNNNWVAADKAVTAWEMSLNLATILEQMTEDGRCEWTTSGTTLRMFRIGMMGSDKPDVIIGGRGFSSVPVRTDATGLYSHIRAVPDKLPWQNYTSDTSLRSRFGHRSILLTQSGISSKSESAKNAAGYIAAGKEVVREESYDWTPDVNLPHPWVDFDLGDQVTAHSRGGKQLRRIVALVVNQDGFEPAQVNVRVGKLIKSRAAKIKDRLDSVSVGGIVGGSGAGFPLNSGPQNNRPAAPAGVLIKSQTGVWLPDGTARTEVEIEWSEVTMAEDGSEIDVVEYEVWSRTPSGTLQRDVATHDLSVVVDTWAINQARVVAVRAKSALGEWSEFSDDLLITVEEPNSIVPKAPVAVTEISNEGSWTAAGPLSAIELGITPVTESTDDTPVTIKEYEIWVDGTPVMRTPTPSATLTQPAGAVRDYRARALSTLDVWGDLSPTLTVTGAFPSVAVRNPTVPVLTTGAGNAFARWDGAYVSGGTAGAHRVDVEARIGAGAWAVQGTLVGAGQQIVTLGVTGDTVAVRLRAYDQLGRLTGTSVEATVTVVGIEFEDFDTASQNYILGIESKADEAVKSTVVQFAKNTSATTAPTSGWSGTRPSRGAGEHIWTRTLITYNNGTTTTTTPFSTTGDQGPQGVPGTPGANGAATYTWIRYADTASGGGISNNPTGKKYIGFAYNQTTATESNTPGDYKWSLIQGEQGVPGAPGANGQPTYTWVRYSANSNGSPIQTTPQATTKYVGIAVNKPTATPSSTPGDYSWSLFKGADGADGISVTSVVRYYRLGTSKPGQPSGASPSGWSTTEPGYAEGQNLYYADKVTYSDDTISWSVVQLSSAYTASAQANAKADALAAGQVIIERTVDGLNHKFLSITDPNIRVIRNGDFSDDFTHWVQSGGEDDGGEIVPDPDDADNPVFYLGSETRKAQGGFDVLPGDKWRLDFRLRSSSGISTFGVARNNGANWVETVGFPATGNAWADRSHTYTIPETGVTRVWVRFAIGGSSGIYVDDVQLTLVERNGEPVDSPELRNGDEWHQLGWKPGENEGDPDRLVIEHIWTWNGQDWVHYDIWAENIFAADSVTARTVNMDEGFADKFWANEGNFGKIKVDYVEPNFGDSLNITANESIEFVVGRQDEQDTAIAEAQDLADTAATTAETAAVDAANAAEAAAIADGKALIAQEEAERANTRVTNQQAVFRVIPTGAEVSSTDNTNAVRITPDGVSIIQGNATASTWSAGRLIVNEAVLVRARIGNHVVERSGSSRTIFRPL